VDEANFFAAILFSNEQGKLRLIEPQRDLSEAWQHVYSWIIQFMQDYGRLPRPATVAGTFQIVLHAPSEQAEFYAASLRENARRAQLEEQLSEKVVPPLADNRSGDAIDAAAQVITDIRHAFPEPDDSRSFLPNMTVNVEERRQDYEYRSRLEQQVGLPLPWQTMNALTRGVQPGEAWCLAARPNIGKSWALIMIAVYLWQLGYRVLFASMETPPRSAIPRAKRVRDRMGEQADVARQRLTIRFDALAARVSAWRLLNGQLSPTELERYNHYLDICRDPRDAGYNWGELRIVSSPLVRSVGQLEQMTMDFEPDIILWDSAYLAIPRSGKQKRTDAAGFFLEDVKHFLERQGVGGIITWHFNREVKEDDTKASMNDIALTDDMGRLFDVILGLFRTPEMEDAGEAIFRSLKVRDGVGIPELRTRFEVKREIRFEEIGINTG